MAGKSFAIVEIKGARAPWTAIATWSGGATNPKTREVPEAEIGGTMREEPTGGVMREDIEITFLEREDESIFLEEPYEQLLAWQKETNPVARRKAMTLQFFSDREFTKSSGRLNVIGAWPKVISSIEYDRSSDDARTFSVTLTHLGSEYAAAGSVTGYDPKTKNEALDRRR
jgi:hypothetical protein